MAYGKKLALWCTVIMTVNHVVGMDNFKVSKAERDRIVYLQELAQKNAIHKARLSKLKKTLDYLGVIQESQNVLHTCTGIQQEYRAFVKQKKNDYESSNEMDTCRLNIQLARCNAYIDRHINMCKKVILPRALGAQMLEGHEVPLEKKLYIQNLLRKYCAERQTLQCSLADIRKLMQERGICDNETEPCYQLRDEDEAFGLM